MPLNKWRKSHRENKTCNGMLIILVEVLCYKIKLRYYMLLSVLIPLYMWSIMFISRARVLIAYITLTRNCDMLLLYIQPKYFGTQLFEAKLDTKFFKVQNRIPLQIGNIKYTRQLYLHHVYPLFGHILFPTSLTGSK